MSVMVRVTTTLAIAAILVAGCGAGSTPSPSTPPAVSPSPAASPSADPTPSLASVASPSPTPVPLTDGQGAERTVGTATDPVLVVQYTDETVDGVQTLRGGTVKMTVWMNDPRATGTMTWEDFSVDVYPMDFETTMGGGPEWLARCRLESAGGAWEGPWTGATWAVGEGVIGSAWLVGSGAYKGYTLYLNGRKEPNAALDLSGVIYPGAPPKP
jgi:hypothetical protein